MIVTAFRTLVIG